MKKIHALLCLLIAFTSVSCTSYVSQEVPFQPPSQSPNMKMAAGAQIAARSYADEGQAKSAFGFNIRDAGLLPVQVVIDHRGSEDLLIIPGETFLIDSAGMYWDILDSKTAYKRVEESSEYGRIAKGAGKGSFLGAAGGAVVGAAIGILGGDSVAEAAGKGAAAGAAAGAVIGGSQEGTSGDAGRTIARDLANKRLENRIISSGSLARGFLFFPGEASSAKELRLRLQEKGSGKKHTLFLQL